MKRLVTGLALLTLVGCGSTSTTDGGFDAGVDAGVDAGMDAGMRDAGMMDAGMDAGMRDGGMMDAGTDGGMMDAGTDGGMMDAGTDGGMITMGTITISNFTFTPTNLTVSPGATITVTNMDSFAHTFTSQSAPGMYTPGGVNGVMFDTGDIAGGTSVMVTIPMTAPHGTIVPFYCNIHKGMMANALQNQITIQ